MAIAGIVNSSSVWTSTLKTSFELGNSIKRLSTGMILPSDDPAGIGISERMRSQISGIGMASRNITNQISMHQTSESFGQTITDNLSRMRDLTIQARGVTNADDRAVMEEEFKMLQDDIVSITSKDTALAEFNDTKLFQGGSKTVQSGPDSGQTTEVEFTDLQVTSTEAAGDITFGEVIDSINGLQMMDTNALDSLDAALDVNSNSRAKNAANERAAQERLEGLRSYEANLRSAESNVRDVDIAKESTNFTKQLIQSQMNSALLAQGNQMDMSAFGLLNLL